MTAEYRATLIRLLTDQARAELMGATLYTRWALRAPGPDERLHLIHLAQEETEHWHKVVGLLRCLDVAPGEFARHQTRWWYYGFLRLILARMKWTDLLVIVFLLDHAGYFLAEEFAESSYGPWAAATLEILDDEKDHPEVGRRFIQAALDRGERATLQRALNKWWRVTLNMFGPPTTKNTALYLRLGLKTRTNEERRHAFLAVCIPRIEALGLRVPRLRRNRYPFV
jgi:ring-1,2-phenylacetyl-CoA epoxidase subunit PaaA